MSDQVEYRYYTDDDDVGLTLDELGQLGPAERSAYVKAWFHKYYWDPANETPYNSREGGYLYVYGGPYTALEEIEQEFHEVIPFDELERIARDIESEDGIYDWAPTPAHPDQIAIREDAEQSHEHWQDDLGEQLRQTVVQAQASGLPNLGSVDELQTRERLKASARRLSASLDSGQPAAALIGHNNPPSAITPDDETVAEEAAKLLSSTKEIERALAAETPDLGMIAAFGQRIWQATTKISAYVAEKADQFVSAAVKAAGAAAGATLILNWQMIEVGATRLLQDLLQWVTALF